MHINQESKRYGIWITQPRCSRLKGTKWVSLLHPAVREQVITDEYEELHAENAFVARKGEAANSRIGVVEGLLKASDRSCLLRKPLLHEPILNERCDRIRIAVHHQYVGVTLQSSVRQ